MSKNGKALATQDNTQIQRPSIEGVESALVEGDLARLTPEQRVTYYEKVCDSVGLNPLTKPFAYIRLNGKLTLYAKRDAAEQLRAVNGISITKMDTEQRGDIYIVRAYAEDSEGRTDVASGAVDLSRKSGEALANAYMKAETKAKRRVTLSMGGLGWLDETEVADIPGGAAETVSYQEAEQPAQLEEITTQQPTWRGEAVSKKQLGALRRIEERLSSTTSYGELFGMCDELREYASKKPDKWGIRVLTLIREAEIDLHGDDALDDEVMEVARNCGGKVLSRHLSILEQHYGDAWGDVKWQALPWSVTTHMQATDDQAQAEAITRQALQHCAEGAARGHCTERERARAESIIAEAAYHLHDIDVDALEQADGAEAGGDLFEEPEPRHNDEG